MRKYDIMEQSKVRFDSNTGWFYILAPRKGSGPARGTARRINLFRVSEQGVSVRVRQLNKLVTVQKDTVLEHLAE